MIRKKELSLEGRLVLHAWANYLIGYESTREMLSDLSGPMRASTARDEVAPSTA